MSNVIEERVNISTSLSRCVKEERDMMKFFN
jgi:hypothetical protein